MASKKYRVIRTFDSPQGIQRRGEIVTFKTDKQGRRFLADGFVELATEPKLSRKKQAKDAAEKSGKEEDKTIKK